MNALNFSKPIACIIGSLFLFMGATLHASSMHQSISAKQIPAKNCEPTPTDYLGPYYKPNAPVRSSVGKGYNLRGMVLSSKDCTPITNARIELWLTGPNGLYDDDHRATIFSDDNGKYSFESNFPRGYYGRPPHIHIRISAAGFRLLTTQHYSSRNQATAEFDIVLIPLN
jgi:protocatechuate 3,4-dioxygenase beta subunit